MEEHYHGHDLCEDVARVMALDEATGLQEEEPYTGD